MQLTRQQAADLCRDLGFEEMKIDKSDPDYKMLSAIPQGLDNLHPCTLEALLRLVPERLPLGELKFPETTEGKVRLKQLLRELSGRVGGWFKVINPFPTSTPAVEGDVELDEDREYQKVCERLSNCDSQQSWEEAAGLPGLQFDPRTVVFSSGASCDTTEVNGNVARKSPPASPRVRAKVVLEYWELRSKRAENVLAELREKHDRRETAPSPKQFAEANAARDEVKLCRTELAKARQRVEAPFEVRTRTAAQAAMDADFQQETREQIKQMEDLLSI